MADALISQTGTLKEAADLNLTDKVEIEQGADPTNESNHTELGELLELFKLNMPVPIGIACSDETSALTTGTAKATFRMPFAFTLSASPLGVRASVGTAPTGAALQVDINEGGVSILSTKLTIDAGEKTSTTAATPAVISDVTLADDAEITIDIDQIGSTIAGAGLKVWLIGRKA